MNINTTNPELLFENGETSNDILNGGVDTVTLANELDKASATVIGLILADYQSRLAPALSNHLVELLRGKVWSATPDELEQVVQEAKDSGRDVWQQIRPVVMARNDRQAKLVRGCNNLPALNVMLESMAKSDSNWLPRSVYDAAIANLRGMIRKATMGELDAIGDLAGVWRCRGELLPDIKARDAALIRSVDRYKKTWGYVVQSGPRQQLVENVRKAIRMVESGWEFKE